MIKEERSDITTGATYYYKAKLPARGEYYYNIYFENKKGCRVYLPINRQDNLGLPGPRVDSSCPSIPDNKPEKYKYTVYVKDAEGNPVDGADVDIDGIKIDMQTDSKEVQLIDGQHAAEATKPGLGTGNGVAR